MEIVPVPTKPRTAVRRIALGRVLAFGGSQASWVALMVVVYDRTHSTFWLSAGLLLTFGASGVFGPLGGMLADRTDRRLVMVGSDLLTGVAAAGMAVAHAPATLLAIAFCAAITAAPFNSAASGAVPNLVGPDDLTWANSTMAIGRNAGALVGPVLGGVLVGAAGGSAVFALFAVCSLASAGLVASVHGSFSTSGEHAAGSESRGLRAGFDFVRDDPVLARMAVAWMVLLFLTGPVLVAELPLARSFGQGSTGYGVLAAAWATGSLAGSFGGRRLSRNGERYAMVGGCLVIGFGFAAVTVAPVFAAVLGGMLVAGLAEGTLSVAEQNIMQRLTPDAVRSRVNAAIEAAALLAFAISFGLAGFAISLLGVRGVYASAALGHVLGAAIMLPAMRDRRITAPAAPFEPAVE